MKIELITGASRGLGRGMALHLAQKLLPFIKDGGTIINILTGFSAYAMMKGAIETDFGNGTVRENKQVNNFISSQTALGRAGYADDIGAALANIVSEECHSINAQRE